MSRARRMRKARKKSLAFQTSCRAISDATKITSESLVGMIGRFEALRRAVAVTRTSRSLARGQTFEYDEPKLFDPVALIQPDGGMKHTARRVLVMNEEDFHEAVSARLKRELGGGGR